MRLVLSRMKPARFFAILEKINRAHQVVLNELTTACHSINTGKNTGIAAASISQSPPGSAAMCY